MNKPAKFHHYVPACYLKHFTVEKKRSGTLWVFHTPEEKKRRSTADREAAENDYNTIDGPGSPDEFEKLMGKYEGELAPIVDEVIASRKLPKDPQQYSYFIEFIATLRVRNLAHRRRLEETYTSGLKVKLQELYSNPEKFKEELKNTITSDLDLAATDLEVLRLRGMGMFADLQLDFPTNWHIEHFPKQVQIFTETFLEFNWRVFETNIEQSFVTSDNPLIVLRVRYYNKNEVPKGAPEPTVIVLPLSPSLVLMGTASWNNLRVLADEAFVRNLNRSQVLGATRHVFGIDEKVTWEDGSNNHLEAEHITPTRIKTAS